MKKIRSAEEIDRIITLYREIKNGKKVAEMTGLHVSVVYDILYEQHVPTKRAVRGKRSKRILDTQVIEAYARLGNAVKVGKELHINEKTVYRALKANSVAIDGTARYRERVQSIRPEDEPRIVQRYVAGEAMHKIAQDFRCSISPILNILRTHDVLTRSRPRFSPEERVKACALYIEGKTFEQVAAIMNRSLSSVRNIISDEQPESIRFTDRKGPQSHVWKGGRYVHSSGYAYVYIADDDPLACMQREGKRHVPEHRIVMARALGRPLSSDGAVHHINGVTHDNRLENLQLRQGKHGKGVRMECQDCGSHNIIAVELSAQLHIVKKNDVA